MKKITSKFSALLFMLSLVVSFSSCAEETQTGPLRDQPLHDAPGCQGIVFAQTTYSKTVEAEPAATITTTITLKRSITNAAGSATITVMNNTDNVFTVPANVDFAAEEVTKNVTITATGTETGKSYSLTLLLSGDNVSNHAAGFREIVINLNVVKWNPAGKGWWVEQGAPLATFFGVSPMMMYFDMEKMVTASSTRYRFTSPWSKYGSDADNYGADAYGAYNCYPYNAAGDVADGDFKIVVTINSDKKVSLLAADGLGNDYGYGMFLMGTIFDQLSASYPSGTYQDNVITFPDQSLWFAMANYNNGGKSVVSGANYIYLTEEAFKASLVKDYAVSIDYKGSATIGTAEHVLADITLGKDVATAYVALVEGSITNDNKEPILTGMLDGTIPTTEVTSSGTIGIPLTLTAKELSLVIISLDPAATGEDGQPIKKVAADDIARFSL